MPIIRMTYGPLPFGTQPSTAETGDGIFFKVIWYGNA
jgi:hypothetical protein